MIQKVVAGVPDYRTPVAGCSCSRFQGRNAQPRASEPSEAGTTRGVADCSEGERDARCE